MRVQVQEELTHAMKILDFVHDRDAEMVLTAVEAPPAQGWGSPLALFQAALDHERLMTERLNNVMDLAIKERDHATNTLMQWFITEQVEEEASVSDIIQKFKLVGKDGSGLYMIDTELATRLPVVTVNAPV
jgi:ferritin